MSKKRKNESRFFQTHQSGNSVQKIKVFSVKRDDLFWKPFEEYNNLDAVKRVAALSPLGIREVEPAIAGILTKSHFVIPGKTRFECQQCGECCRYARKMAQLTYEPCLYLTPENTCTKHDHRYLVCKWFPFWIFNSPLYGPLLTIKPYCTGFGQGALVEYQATIERIANLATAQVNEGDGAFVIHEVLRIPGRKDWVFPSRSNVDALIHHINAEAKKSVPEQPPQPLESMGEVHYAHHYTSGLLGTINSPLLTIDEQNRITDINDAACALFSRERGLIVGRAAPLFFVNPERAEASMISCFSHGKETASAQRLHLPDETTVPVLLNGLVYRSRTDGLVHGSLVCITPVPFSVFSEISQSRNYARGLLEASLDALIVIDRDGVITDINETVTALTGLSRERIIGAPFKDLFIDREKAAHGVSSAFELGSVRNFELALFKPEGISIPVSLNATVYRDTEGIVQGIFAAARDIRERLAMMRALEEAKNYARGLIECCIDLMVTIDREGVITDANHAAAVITGRKRESLIGSPFKNFFDDPEKASRGINLTFANGEVRNYEMNLLTTTGTTVAVSFNATLYRDSQGMVQGVFAIARVKE